MEAKDLKEVLRYKNFKWRGRDKEGIDCFGFFLDCCKRMGMEVPDYVYNEKNAAKLLLKEYHKFFMRVDIPHIGDAILFRGNPLHIGIYVGEKRFIHFRKDMGAKVDNLYQKPWADQVYGYFRYVGK